MQPELTKVKRSLFLSSCFISEITSVLFHTVLQWQYISSQFFIINKVQNRTSYFQTSWRFRFLFFLCKLCLHSILQTYKKGTLHASTCSTWQTVNVWGLRFQSNHIFPDVMLSLFKLEKSFKLWALQNRWQMYIFMAFRTHS